MNILLLGSGGREDALAWRLRQSPSCDRLIAAPGNPGIARWAECIDVDPCDDNAVLTLAKANNIDLAVIGPEAPLVAGVADSLRKAGIAVFGPIQTSSSIITGSFSMWGLGRLVPRGDDAIASAILCAGSSGWKSVSAIVVFHPITT